VGRHGRLRLVHAWFGPAVATFPLVLHAEREEKTAAGRRREGKREEKEKEGKEKERKRYGKFFKLENF
jgi:hypothetical protein